MSVNLHSLGVLAKGASAGGPIGPSPEDVLLFFGVLGTSLLVWSLISAALFRAALATFNRYAAEEDQTAQVNIGRALLAGFLYVSLMIVVFSVVSIGVGIVIPSMVGSMGSPRNVTPFPIWLVVTWVSMMLSGWLLKSLLSTVFVPCRFASASHVGIIWSLYEMLVYVLIFAAMYVAVGFSGSWPTSWGG